MTTDNYNTDNKDTNIDTKLVSNSVSSTTSITRSRACSIEDLTIIRNKYTSVTGQSLTFYIALTIEDAIRAGMDVDVILSAIEQTSRAPRPSGAYLRAILLRWMRDGVLSPEALAADQAAHDAAKAKPWWASTPGSAMDYQQRIYTDADYEGYYFNPEKGRYDS